MPPRRKVKKEEYSDDEGSEGFVVPDDEDSEEDVKPQKKKAAPKKAPVKRKAAITVKKEEDVGEDAAAGDKPKPKKAKNPPPPKEVTTYPDGWTVHPPSLIYKLNPEAQGGSKVACFDLDGTLVGVKSGAMFATNADDWRWFNKNVPKTLRELHADGYQILIISNQGGIKGALVGVQSTKTRGRVDSMLAALNNGKGPDVPVQVIMAAQKDEYRKPEPGMWNFFVQHANRGVQPDLSQCFYVGDAAGRPTDIGDGADSDKQFAANVGIEFFLPEDKFGDSELKTAVRFAEGSGGGKNAALATAFQQLAELAKDSAFKAAAFKKVAAIIADFPEVIKSAKDLAGVKGVGPSSQAKITEFLDTGKLAALEEVGVDAGKAPVNKAAEVAMKFI